MGVRVPREQYMDVPVVSFLLEHPTAGPVLIDTGFHSSVAVDPNVGIGRFGGLLFKELRMEADDAVPAQLRAREIDPAAVRTVLMTHLHSDHASGISEFPGATFLLSAAEWKAASNARETDGYIRRQFDHAFDYRTLDFDSAETDSFASFGRAFDVFGDGSVRMVFTPGHTHGHCSVVVRVSDREVLVAGDAAYTMRTIHDSALPSKMSDEHRFRRSLKEIQLYMEQTPDAVVIPGHDMQAWRLLDAVL
jgi:glyoxylase-like metal-dependent hydrolase (beta-lactamase superfamily II)